MSSQYKRQLEAKRDFRDWTIAGLEFLLREDNPLESSVRAKAQRRLQTLKKLSQKKEA